MKGLRGITRRLPFRIMAPLLAVNLLVFGLLAAFLGAWAGRTGTQSLEHRFQVVADAMALNAELPMLASDTESLQRVLGSVRHLPEVIEVSALDGAGTEVLRYRPQGDSSYAGETLTIESSVTTVTSAWTDFELEFVETDSDGKLLIGQIQILVSKAQALAETRRIQTIILGTWLTLVLAALLVGWLVARALARPLAELVQATQDVAAGDLSVRPAPNSTDEIGELSRSFSSMAADLEAYQRALLEEQANLEQRVRERTAELEQTQARLIGSERLTAVGQMVAGVAHELNNPLAVVLGYSSLLKRKYDPESAAKKLDHITDAAERARRIVHNLMTFARRQESERGPVQLNEIVTGTVELREYELRDAGIAVQLKLATKLTPIYADLHQMQQVVLNLLINAEQAIRGSGSGSAIEIITRTIGDEVMLVVRDDGPGMPAEVRDRIFEPFFTTKDVGSGTGLGLSIVYGILRDHGGTISVDSEPGYARFELRLPSNDAATDRRTERAVLNEPPDVAAERRLLVVDDNPDVLSFVSEALEMLDIEVVEAHGGQQALDLLSSDTRYDAVLSDMRMPGVDGRQVFEFVRRNRPELVDRFIFVTGDVGNEQSVRFIEEAGCDLLDKPFTVRALWEKVRAKLDAVAGSESPG